MFNWIHRVVFLVVFCYVGVSCYVYRDSYTIDQFGWFTCLLFIITGAIIFLREIANDFKNNEIAELKGGKKHWQDKWLESRGAFRRLELKRCPRANGWLVREWDGYFLRDDTDIRRDCREDDMDGRNDEEAYSLFRLRPYGRVEVFVGEFAWVLKKAERAIAKDRGEKFVDAIESTKIDYDELSKKLVETFGGRVDDISVTDGTVSAKMTIDVVKPVDSIVLNLGDLVNGVEDTHVGVLTKEAFNDACKVVADSGDASVKVAVFDTNDPVAREVFRDFTGSKMVDDLVKRDGIEPGEVVAFIPYEKGGKTFQFESTVGPIVIDTRGIEVLDKMAEFMEVDKPTAYDPLIGDTGTTMVPVPKVTEKKVDDPNTIWGQLAKMNREIGDKIATEEDKKAWNAMLMASQLKANQEGIDDGPSVSELEIQTDCWTSMREFNDNYDSSESLEKMKKIDIVLSMKEKRARAEDDGVFENECQNEVPVIPVRMLFSELALGARFRYIKEGVDVYDTVWIKLSDFDNRGAKCGLIAEYDSKFIRHKNWVGQSVCCAEEGIESCKSLVVEIVE